VGIPTKLGRVELWSVESVNQFYQPFDDYAANQNKDLSVTDGVLGNIKATIWQNVSEKGPFFSATSLARSPVQRSSWRMAQRHLGRSRRPGGVHECRL
jgi:hypothetical protein